MKLSQFKVKNFRSLRNVDWVQVHDLTAFIGVNDGGKTSSIETIKFLLSPRSKPEITDYTWDSIETGELCRTTEIVIEAILLPKNEEEKVVIQEYIGSDVLHIKRTWCQDGTSSFKILGMVCEIEEFRTNWTAKTVPQLKELAAMYNIDLKRVALKNDIIAQISDWLKAIPKVEGEVDMPSNILELLPRVEVFSSANSLDPEKVVNEVLRSICNTEIGSGKYVGQIKQIEEGITDALVSKVQELKPYIKKYYEDVEAVNVDPKFNISSGLNYVPLQLVTTTGPIELNKKGQGKKRQVTLGIYEWSTKAFSEREAISQDIIFVLDEPDTHMDYASQRKLFDIIKKFIDIDLQVIISTHSLNLINRIPVNKIDHFILDKDGYTIVDSLTIPDEDTEEYFINEIGLSIGLDTGTIFHERCFLIVEGPTEMHALPQLFQLYYKQSLHSAGIKLINGENNGGVRNFAKFLHRNRRKVLFLLDNDCKTGPSKKIFTKERLESDGFDVENQALFVGDQEFEDAFPNDVYMEIGDKLYPKVSSWTDADFDSVRVPGNKFSASLSAMFRASKPEIGYALGKHVRTKEKIPQVIKTLFETAFKLANNS